MNYINIPTKTLRSHEFLSATNEQRGIWVTLYLYCVDQETGGILKNCNDWNEREWRSLTGLEKQDVASDSKLWHWKGPDLVIYGYNHEAEAHVRTCRVAGKIGGLRTQSKRRKAEQNRALEQTT